MAIDPKLVSIKKAVDLPSGIPTANGEFLYWEDETLMKAEMSDLYDKVNSGITGEATQSNAPGSVGFERWIVSTPLTLPNSWGFEVTQLELDENFVFFNVTDGVVSKELSAKPIADPIDVDEKTFVGKNLANPALIVDGQWINSSGDFANLAGWKVIKHVPVTPNTNVIFSGHDPAGVTKYVLFEDINKVKISAPSTALNTTTKVVNIPAGCHFISASIKNTSNADPTNLQIEYGTVATPFEAYTETFAVEKINANKILASYFQEFEVGNTYKKDEIVYSVDKIYRSKINGNTALVTDTASWQNIGGSGGGSAYDQSLNTTDDVTFDVVTANEVNINGVLKKGTLASPPVGLLTSEFWLDTTDSAINPILRQKQ